MKIRQPAIRTASRASQPEPGFGGHECPIPRCNRFTWTARHSSHGGRAELNPIPALDIIPDQDHNSASCFWWSRPRLPSPLWRQLRSSRSSKKRPSLPATISLRWMWPLSSIVSIGGAGFLTTIAVQAMSRLAKSFRRLGRSTYARVDGLKYTLGFALFMENGRLSLLHGYSCGHEDTSCLRLADVPFRIVRSPSGART